MEVVLLQARLCCDPLNGHRHTHLEQLLRIGLALSIDVERHQASTAKSMREQKVPAVDAWQFVSTHFALCEVRQVLADGLSSDELREEWIKARLTHKQPDVCHVSFVATTTVAEIE